ncbi:MAG: BrnA antitoxin family protein [Magnetococcales bacterium]|nr:BrnA antitoxin family protein [Magnetococcales bacterium]
MNGKSPASGTDWSKVDAHIIQPEEYEELPEWTDAMFEAAEVREGGKLVRRGRPPDDAPELTGKEMDRPDAVWSIGERAVSPEEGKAAFRAALRKGRPPGGKKVSTTVRFDAAVLEAFRAGGKGWQTRMNDALREWLKEHSPAA